MSEHSPGIEAPFGVESRDLDLGSWAVNLENPELEEVRLDLERKCARLGKRLLPADRELLKSRAIEIITTDQQEIFREDLFLALEKKEGISAPTQFFREKKRLIDNLAKFLSSNQDSSNFSHNEKGWIRDQLKALLRAEGDGANSKLFVADLIGQETVRTLTLIQNQMLRTATSFSPDRHARLVKIVTQLQSSLQQLETLFVYLSECLSLRSGEAVSDFVREGTLETEFVSQLANNLHIVEELASLSKLYHQIENLEAEKHRRAYLWAEVLIQAAKQGMTDDVFALELITDPERLPLKMSDILKSMTEEWVSNTDNVELSSDRGKLKQTLLLLVFTATLVASTPESSRAQYLNQVNLTPETEMAAQVDSEVQKAMAVSPTESSMSESDDTEIGFSEATAADQNHPNSGKPIEAVYEGGNITSDQLYWQDPSSFGVKSSAESHISAESYINQSMQVVWEIEGEASNNSYLITAIQPEFRVEERDSLFTISNADKTSWVQLPESSTLATTHLKTKLRHNHAQLPVPVNWDSQLVSARAELVDDKTGKSEPVQVEVGITGLGEVRVGFDQVLDQSAQDNGKYIRLDLGIAPGFVGSRTLELIHRDADAKLQDFSVYPEELQQLITKLNADASLDDQGKLEQLQRWFKVHGTYSMDKRSQQYYRADNPDLNTYLRRVFGTCQASDSHCSSDQSLIMNGVCEATNVWFAQAARELNLNNGQIMMAQGFVRAGIFRGQPTALTNGQLHAWAIYISNDGKLVHFDATPTRMDSFTQSVVDAAGGGAGGGGEGGQYGSSGETAATSRDALSFAPERYMPYVERKKLSKLSFDQAIPLGDGESTLEKLDRAMERKEDDQWQIDIDKIDGPTLNFFNYLLPTQALMVFDNQTNSWVESATNSHWYEVNLNADFQLSESEVRNLAETFEISPEKVDQRQIERSKLKMRGTITLTSGTVALPSFFGPIDHQSITVFELVKRPDGGVDRMPLAIDGLFNNGTLNNYKLLLVGEKDDLVGKQVEIEYQAVVLNPYTLLDTATQGLESASDIFAATQAEILPLNWLDDDLKQFIALLNSTLDYEELKAGIDPTLLANHEYIGYFDSDWQYLKDLDSQAGQELRNEMIDRFKKRVLHMYLSCQYQISLGENWSRYYATGNPSPEEFWLRVAKHKVVTSDIFNTLYAASVRHVWSSWSTESYYYKIPLLVTKNSTAATFALASSLQDYQMSQFLGAQSIEANREQYNLPLSTLVFADLYPILFNGGESTLYDILGKPYYAVDSNNYFRSLGENQIVLSPLSASQAARLLGLIISDDVALEHYPDVATFMAENTLSEEEEFFQSIREQILVEFYNQTEGNVPLTVTFELTLMVLAIVYLERKIRNQISWSKDLDPKDFQRVIEEIKSELDIDEHHPMYGYVQRYFESVLRPLVGRKKKPFIDMWQTASRARKFFRSEEAAHQAATPTISVRQEDNLQTNDRRHMVFQPDREIDQQEFYTERSARVREKASQWLRSSRQHDRLTKLATMSVVVGSIGFDEASVRLARKLLTEVWGVGFLQGYAKLTTNQLLQSLVVERLYLPDTNACLKYVEKYVVAPKSKKDYLNAYLESEKYKLELRQRLEKTIKIFYRLQLSDLPDITPAQRLERSMTNIDLVVDAVFPLHWAIGQEFVGLDERRKLKAQQRRRRTRKG